MHIPCCSALYICIIILARMIYDFDLASYSDPGQAIGIIESGNVYMLDCLGIRCI